MLKLRSLVTVLAALTFFSGINARVIIVTATTVVCPTSSYFSSLFSYSNSYSTSSSLLITSSQSDVSGTSLPNSYTTLRTQEVSTLGSTASSSISNQTLPASSAHSTLTSSPTSSPSGSPTSSPTGSLTSSPTSSPTGSPTSSPTSSPTGSPGYCTNSPSSRQCWGNYSIDTDWYSVVPDTGVTREYWLSVENTTLSPDGYERYTLTFNGTVPGPTIIADWGDNLVIHVTNNLQDNGTSIHWHGLRQLGSSEYDGVPGVTQCPIAPGASMTYRFRATQYGSTWYHSHFSLQYAEGLFGPLILNGPATSNYDEDLGLLFLQDWSHTPIFQLWDQARVGAPPTLDGGLINGTNTFDCASSLDPKCVGGGKKFETVFVPGKRYRIRLINVAIEGHFQFSIDGHNFTVISNDLVPIVPYNTSSIVIGEGQRYDIVVEANAAVGDYWIRAGWQTACSTVNNAADITGIVRYDASSTSDPVTTSDVIINDNCADEPLETLVPYLAMNVGNFSEVTQETLGFVFENYFMWTINTSSLYMNWSDPTTLKVLHGLDVFPTEYNVVPVEKTNPADEWAVYVIQDKSGIGLSHPIHLHGHDFFVLGQEADSTFSLTDSPLNLLNPTRRDVASLPANGYLVLAFKKDNPGAWIVHCHIAWHASEGLGLEFVESQSEISIVAEDLLLFEETCAVWDSYTEMEAYPQDDSGV